MGDALEASPWKRGFPALEHFKEPVGEELGAVEALLDRRAICHDSLSRGGRFDTTRQRIECLGNSMAGGCRRTRQCRIPARPCVVLWPWTCEWGYLGRRCRRC